MDTAQLWELIKLLIVAIVAAMLAKMDRDHRDFQKQNTELFKDLFSRVRRVELRCATTHGNLHRRVEDDDDES